MSREDKEKRLAKMRKRLAALDKMLKDAGIKPKPYHDLPCNEIINAGLGNCSRDWDGPLSNFVWKENFIHPVQQFQKSLSFDDIETNEICLIGLPILTAVLIPLDYIVQMNRRFVHTFLETCG